jgi:uncharacterized membrane protein HdeD (DUF308 family)
MLKISGLWLGIILIVIGILVLVLPALIQWVIGISLIVLGILAIVRK